MTGGAGAAGPAGRDEGFWRFSLAFYSTRGVAESLLALQDRGGFDVNMILYVLWLGLQGRRLDAGTLADAAVAAAPLRDIVAALRDLRRRLKPDPDLEVQAMRRRILALELAGERRVQARLACVPAGKPQAADRPAIAEANLALYLGPAAAGSAEAATLRRAFDDFTRRR